MLYYCVSSGDGHIYLKLFLSIVRKFTKDKKTSFNFFKFTL